MEKHECSLEFIVSALELSQKTSRLIWERLVYQRKALSMCFAVASVCAVDIFWFLNRNQCFRRINQWILILTERLCRSSFSMAEVISAFSAPSNQLSKYWKHTELHFPLTFLRAQNLGSHSVEYFFQFRIVESWWDNLFSCLRPFKNSWLLCCL